MIVPLMLRIAAYVLLALGAWISNDPGVSVVAGGVLSALAALQVEKYNTSRGNFSWRLANKAAQIKKDKASSSLMGKGKYSDPSRRFE